jgi:protein TonB
VYPEIARKAGLEGTVWVKIWVGKEGKPRKVVIQKSASDIFDQAAVDAANRFVFTPAMMQNGPVDVWVSIPFHFRLK